MLSWSHQEKDEDEDENGDGVAARDCDIELVHQKPLRSITKKREKNPEAFNSGIAAKVSKSEDDR